MAMRGMALVAGLAMALTALPATAQIEIDITRGQVEPVPIAVTGLAGESGPERQLGADIAAVVSGDLDSSGLFRPLDPRSFLQKPDQIGVVPRFGDWRQINAQALVTGKLSIGGDGFVDAEFRLWDVFSEQYMTGFRLRAPRDKWRRVAHLVADAVYQRITGEDGYFDTRIVYVAETGPAESRIKRLAIMDQDGANHRFLTDGRHLVLTPRFSPTLQEITYLSYLDGQPRVYIRNIDTGQQEILGKFRGNMTIAPRFSPDGNKVVMSVTLDGNTEIHELDLRTGVQLQLTRHPAIDTAPSYSPDGQRVAFESDRSGTQQIYVMNADGSGVERISFGQGRYATPVWSPRGDWIAFTKSRGSTFYIGVMRPDGNDERLLSTGFLVEGPTWAPNGRVLMFFRDQPGGGGREERVRLISIDITGRNEREIVTPTDASDPAWSPLIPRDAPGGGPDVR
ncbi:MAG: Tol-Pal system beta propeller repeat protein TolB [Alphaproteobacteria bacterium]|nr:Tol-Pal system beta propeller repeat protein TolB [Alphaproteobacteria bacterium]